MAYGPHVHQVLETSLDWHDGKLDLTTVLAERALARLQERPPWAEGLRVRRILHRGRRLLRDLERLQALLLMCAWLQQYVSSQELLPGDRGERLRKACDDLGQQTARAAATLRGARSKGPQGKHAARCGAMLRRLELRSWALKGLTPGQQLAAA